MNCTNCGAQIPGNSTYCPSCGAQGAPDTNPYAPPSGGGRGNYGGPQQSVPDYLIWSIITTLCCCLPLGIVAIVMSVQSKSEEKAGNYDSAVSKSKTAFYCNLIGMIGGFIISVVWIVINILAVAAAEGGGGF